MRIETTYEKFLIDILADPITKMPKKIEHFQIKKSIIDARVYLKNTYGYSEWIEGQEVFENWDANEDGYSSVQAYHDEIKKDSVVFNKFRFSGVVLDVGGGPGIIREFIPADCKYISIDPHISVVDKIPTNKYKAYSCLARPLNFIAGNAEFLPIQSNTVDFINMRSMLDHVQIPDLALIEARRVLRSNGKLLIGLLLERGPDDKFTILEWLKHEIKELLGNIGITRYKDHHVWHPTYANLTSIVEENGFNIDEVFWQPGWNNKVIYLLASPA